MASMAGILVATMVSKEGILMASKEGILMASKEGILMASKEVILVATMASIEGKGEAEIGQEITFTSSV